MTRMQKIFIANLRWNRTKAGFTQLSFSEKLGLSPNYLNAVENGKNFPSVEVLQKIADALKVQPYELFLENPVTQEESSYVGQALLHLKQEICDLLDKEIEEYGRKQD